MGAYGVSLLQQPPLVKTQRWTTRESFKEISVIRSRGQSSAASLPRAGKPTTPLDSPSAS